MGDVRQVWRAAGWDAQLDDGDRERIAAAIALDEDLEAELSYLLAGLSANLAGTFLREFADRVSAEGAEGASAQVLAALERTLAPGAVDRALRGRHG